MGRTHVAVGLVACALGVAFVPASAERVAHPGVVYRSLLGPVDPVNIGAVWRDDPDPVRMNFLALCLPGRARGLRDLAPTPMIAESAPS